MTPRHALRDGTLKQAIEDAIELLKAMQANVGKPATMWLTTHEAAKCSRAIRRLEAHLQALRGMYRSEEFKL